MADKRDYYEVLGVPRSAATEDVKKAYRRLARKHHPDVNRHDEQAEETFKEINEAYCVLCDPDKRRRYDQFGHEGVNDRFAGSGFGGFTDMGGFGDIFDMFFGGQRPGRQSLGQDGDDLRYDLEVTLEEVLAGAEKTLRMTRHHMCETCRGSGARAGSSAQPCAQCGGTGQVRQRQQTILGTVSTVTACRQCRGEGFIISDPCPDCGGQGRHRLTAEQSVHVPAGVESGMRIRVRGEGDAGARGGRPGDLYIVIHVKHHPKFKRRGDDILTELTINFVQAALGDTVSIAGIEDEEKLPIPPGTQPGTSFRLRGKGLPNINNGVRGDHEVLVNIAIPTKLSNEQKKLMLDMAKSMGIELNPEEDKGFFEKLMGK